MLYVESQSYLLELDMDFPAINAYKLSQKIKNYYIKMQAINQIQLAAQMAPSMDLLTRNHERTLEYLTNSDIISLHQPCPKCEKFMTKYEDNTGHYIDGSYLVCLPCEYSQTIRKNSFFQTHDRIHLMILTRIIFFYFCNGANTRKVCHELPTIYGEYGKIGLSTIKRIYSDLRGKLAENYRILWRLTKLPAEHIYEMDETLLTHKPKKPNGSKGERQVWGIGIVSRATGDARVFIVENRSSAVINEIVKKNIQVGARIYTDFWKGYTDLNSLGYDHRAVNKTGIGSGHAAETNLIESLWSEIKGFAAIYSKAIPAKNADLFVCEMIFRRDMRRLGLNFEDTLAKLI